MLSDQMSDNELPDLTEGNQTLLLNINTIILFANKLVLENIIHLYTNISSTVVERE